MKSIEQISSQENIQNEISDKYKYINQKFDETYPKMPKYLRKEADKELKDKEEWKNIEQWNTIFETQANLTDLWFEIAINSWKIPPQEIANYNSTMNQLEQQKDQEKWKVIKQISESLA